MERRPRELQRSEDGLVCSRSRGIVWAAALVPIQLKQSRILRGLGDGQAVPDRYWRLGRWWMVLGTLATLATLLPLVNVVLMVMKPV